MKGQGYRVTDVTAPLAASVRAEPKQRPSTLPDGKAWSWSPGRLLAVLSLRLDAGVRHRGEVCAARAGVVSSAMHRHIYERGLLAVEQDQARE